MAGKEERLTKEQIEEARERLRKEGYEVIEIRPYDPKDPTTDRRKNDRRKPPAKKSSGFWGS